MTTSTVPSSQYEWALQALWDNKFFFLLVAYFIYKHVVGKQPFPEHPGHKVTNLSSVEEWKKFLDSNKKCVVDYYATWCYPCRACSVAYGQLSEEYDPKGWKFAKVDIDLAKDVAFRADIKQMPTFKMYEDGKEVQDLTGFQPGTMKAYMDGEKPPCEKKCC